MKELKQVIVIRSDLGMGKGKIAAQVSHASLESALKAKQKKEWNKWFQEWRKKGGKKIVVKVNSEQKLINLKTDIQTQKIPHSLITDAGHTQIPPNTKTCLGIGPAPNQIIDPYTKDLDLL